VGERTVSGEELRARRAVASAQRLLRVTLVALSLLLVIAASIGLLSAGPGGAASAALGVALTGVLFGGGLLGLRQASGRRASMGPIMAALTLRLLVYASAFALISRAAWMHGPSLALATAASIAVMLAVELAAVAREPVAELELDRDDLTGTHDDASTTWS
jgi:hypothetical protein